ncbi:MAG: ADP-glyceromanno-heptose 6-epimerase [Alphaproteobacteria bacterium]
MIVVTGGAGFIGSNLIATLEAYAPTARRLELVVCDRWGSGDKWRNIAKHEISDWVPPERLFDFLNSNTKKIDAIFHMGAISSTVETDVDLIAETNFSISLRLWEWCTKNKVRLIYASSAATYGDGAAGFDDDNDPRVLAQLQPLNPYGWSKHTFDRRVIRLAAAGIKPPQWVGLKFFNVYGPNEYHKEGQRSVVVQMYQQIQREGRIRLFKSHREGIADGDQRRDFVWVGDCAAVMMWLYDNPKISGIFNLGTGQARSFADLALAVFSAMGRPAEIDYIPMPEAIRRHYQYFTEARMERLRKAGYKKPFASIEDGVRSYVRTYLATEDPFL